MQDGDKSKEQLIAELAESEGQRERVEAALRENTALLNRMQALTHIGHWELDLATNDVSGSDELFKIFGLGPDEASLDAFVAAVHPEDREYDLAHIQRGIDHGESWDIEHRLLTNDGAVKMVHAIGEAITNETGKTVRLLGTVDDITERKQAEEVRLELEGQLHQARKHEALGTLAGGIAHDFNNLLQGILGNTDLAMWDLPEDSEPRRCLEQVMAGGRRAAELVQQILAFSQKTKATRDPLRLQEVLAEALKLLRPALPSTIEIQQHVDEAVGLIFANSAQMHQVITNLATNASHAMRDSDSGVLELRLEATTVDEASEKRNGLPPGNYARLTVSDTGHGMDGETQKHIFDPYFTTKEVGEGSGLGLATVYGIVESHGGTITVESEEGQGSKFIVLLPLVDRKSTMPSEQLGLGLAPRGTERVMFVDDEAGIVQMTKLGLERLGYVVEAHPSSVEALAAFRAAPEQYDLVVTDQTMPKMTGVHLAEAVLKIRRDCPIILCSGFSEVVNEEQAMALGIAAYVTKPLIVRDLAQTIRNVLASREEAESSDAAS